MSSGTGEWLILKAVLISIGIGHVDRPLASHHFTLWPTSTSAVQCAAWWRVHCKREEILWLGIICYIAFSRELPAQVSQCSGTEKECRKKHDIEQ